MEHFARMQTFHRHEPRPILWPELRLSAKVSQSDSEVGTTTGGGPGSGLGSSSENGSDRAFRIVKSETIKRVDHKR